MSVRARAARFTVIGAVLVGVVVSVLPPAVAAPADVVVGEGPHQGERADDGTTELSLTVWNVSSEELDVALRDVTRCEAPAEQTVPASSQTDVTFTMNCEAGSEKRTASLVATSGDDTTTVDVTFSVTSPSGPRAGPMLWFLAAVLLGLFAVVPPYRVWRRSPAGNRPGTPSGGVVRRVSTSLGLVVGSGAEPDPTTGKTVREALELRLPGITADWSFADNWASNAGLATALFTGVFAATDPLGVVLGTESSEAQSTIVVASALAAALIAAAPLLLVIFKRRYQDVDGGVARDHTVIGVLAASFAVVTASCGLVLTAAWVLGNPWAWVAAVAATVLLVVYAWKSIPQTLALGRFVPAGGPPARWHVHLRTVDGRLKGNVVACSPSPEPTVAGGTGTGVEDGRPPALGVSAAGRRGAVSGMP